MEGTHKTLPQNTMTDKQEVEARAEARKFREEYVAAREKAAKEGYASLTSYEQLVLEKGNDYLLG